MLGIVGLPVALWLGLAAAAAAVAAPVPADRDRAAVEALERNVVALPGPRPGPRLAPLAERMREMRVPAVSVAFIEGGRVKWARAYGEAVAGSGRKVPPPPGSRQARSARRWPPRAPFASSTGDDWTSTRM